MWLPFDLHPEYPPEGISRADLVRRYGEGFHRNLQLAFEREELVYNPPAEVVPNSHAALRLTELARSQGRHGVTHDRLMQAYWEDDLNIGGSAVLRTLLQSWASTMQSRRSLRADEIRVATGQAHAIGIDAIPAFLLERRLIVLGAQPPDVFERAFERLQQPG